MLWIALHFPRLPLEAYAQASASTEAHAVAEGERVHATWADFAEPMQDSMERLSRAWGIVGHLHSVNDIPPWREAYNAMLPDLVPEEKLGRLSGWGWGLGYAGGLACLVIALFGLIRAQPFGLDAQTAEPVRATALLVSAWTVVFALPLLLFTPDRKATAMGLYVIGGRNGQGKSSLLDAITYALQPGSAPGKRPVHGDEQKAVIVVKLADDNGEAITIRRVVTADGKAQLVVPEPSATLMFDTQKILVQPPGIEHPSFAGAVWSDNLPKMMQQKIIQSLCWLETVLVT